ncbi:MAG: serine/threonine-protein kinase [Gemmataceae bacterium]
MNDPSPVALAWADFHTTVIGSRRSGLPSLPAGTTRLGHFDLLETIGAGGYGVVVKAFDGKLRREVAIKLLATELAASPAARSRFIDEARAAAAVRHEHVVQIHAVEEQPVPYLVMEYVPGVSLERHLAGHGPLGVEEVVRIGAQVARGLAAAHARGLVHRDIKPANILLEGDARAPRVKLTDFGLALPVIEIQAGLSVPIVGTPWYMSPEQARGAAIDARSDLYSLGTVLYEMLSGQPPFTAVDPVEVLDLVAEITPPSIREVVPDTPDWLAALLDRLHAPRPEDRVQTAGEVADLFDRYRTGKDGSGRVRRAAWKLAALALVASAAWSAARYLSAPVPPAARTDATDSAPPAPTSAALADRYTNAVGMRFVRVPRGSSRLGGTGGRPGEWPVTVPADFYLGTFRGDAGGVGTSDGTGKPAGPVHPRRGEGAGRRRLRCRAGSIPGGGGVVGRVPGVPGGAQPPRRRAGVGLPAAAPGRVGVRLPRRPRPAGSRAGLRLLRRRADHRPAPRPGEWAGGRPRPAGAGRIVPAQPARAARHARQRVRAARHTRPRRGAGAGRRLLRRPGGEDAGGGPAGGQPERLGAR